MFIFLFFRSPKTVHPKQLASLRERLSHLDPIGTTLALAALICFARAFQVAGITKPWNSSEIIRLLAGSAVLTLAFLLSQKLLDDRAGLV